MEIGESNAISLSSQNLDLDNNSENYHLSLEIEKHQLSFCLLDTSKLQYVYLKSVKTNNTNGILDLINKQEILKYNFFSSSVAYKNDFQKVPVV